MVEPGPPLISATSLPPFVMNPMVRVFAGSDQLICTVREMGVDVNANGWSFQIKVTSQVSSTEVPGSIVTTLYFVSYWNFELLRLMI